MVYDQRPDLVLLSTVLDALRAMPVGSWQLAVSSLHWAVGRQFLMVYDQRPDLVLLSTMLDALRAMPVGSLQSPVGSLVCLLPTAYCLLPTAHCPLPAYLIEQNPGGNGDIE